MNGRVLKGEFGYYKAQEKREWVKTLLLFCIAAGLLITGMLVSMHRNPGISLARSKYNLLTVAAVLGILPAARSMVNAIMLTRAKKHSCPEEIRDAVGGDCNPTFELFLTEEKATYPLFAAVCTESEILGLLDGTEEKARQGEAHIQRALQKDGKRNVTVKLFTSQKAFLDRVRNISDNAESGRELMTLLLQISL
ncbi:MAG: hypothetical protein K6E50_09600 [Lachnospiraceae bacterium]|nr:hypothetical protein [Lachnospiraceae bacterium]